MIAKPLLAKHGAVRVSAQSGRADRPSPSLLERCNLRPASYNPATILSLESSPCIKTKINCSIIVHFRVLTAFFCRGTKVARSPDPSHSLCNIKKREKLRQRLACMGREAKVDNKNKRSWQERNTRAVASSLGAKLGPGVLLAHFQEWIELNVNPQCGLR